MKVRFGDVKVNQNNYLVPRPRDKSEGISVKLIDVSDEKVIFSVTLNI